MDRCLEEALESIPMIGVDPQTDYVYLEDGNDNARGLRTIGLLVSLSYRCGSCELGPGFILRLHDLGADGTPCLYFEMEQIASSEEIASVICEAVEDGYFARKRVSQPPKAVIDVGNKAYVFIQ